MQHSWYNNNREYLVINLVSNKVEEKIINKRYSKRKQQKAVKGEFRPGGTHEDQGVPGTYNSSLKM